MAASPRSTSLTNASGLATVSFTTGTLVASGTVTATDGAALTGTSSTITTIAGAATQYLVTSTNYGPVAGSAVTIWPSWPTSTATRSRPRA